MPYKDPQKYAEYHQQYRDTHKEESQRYNKAYRANRKEWIDNIKLESGCIKCGENRLPCLEFHHRDPKAKEGKISFILSHWPKKRILAEITKCDILCANCHKMSHFELGG